MTKHEWYAELHHPDKEVSLKWSGSLPDFAAVRALILDAKRKGEHDIVRIRAPLDASRHDLDSLVALGGVNLL